jgi:hypothetical protein
MSFESKGLASFLFWCVVWAIYYYAKDKKKPNAKYS